MSWRYIRGSELGRPKEAVGVEALPRCIDLKSMAGELEARGGDPALRRTIARVWRTQSCLGDLRQAAETTKTLAYVRSSPRKQGTAERSNIERSLMAAAIMLYARATTTSGQPGERGAIQLDQNKLTAGEKVDHQALLDVRNKAQAHVYLSSPIMEEDWHEAIVFAAELPNSAWHPAAASRQIAFHKPTFERLMRQIPVAIRLVQESAIKAMQGMTDQIGASRLSQEVVERHVFDPAARFGGHLQAKRILSGSGNPGSALGLWSGR